MFKVLLWDMDGTILDFKEAEKAAIYKCFEIIGGLGKCNDQMIEAYSKINQKYWEALERGEMDKQEILVKRFEEFFESYGLDVSKAEAFNDEYQIRLGDTVVFVDDCKELLISLNDKYIQGLVTNGTKVAQDRKLKNSGLDQIFDKVFISDEIGYEKPSKEFFDQVFASYSQFEKDDFLIIGDSLTSDIRGGNNVGIKTCFYNPNGIANNKGVHIDYEISDLQEIVDILK